LASGRYKKPRVRGVFLGLRATLPRHLTQADMNPALPAARGMWLFSPWSGTMWRRALPRSGRH